MYLKTFEPNLIRLILFCAEIDDRGEYKERVRIIGRDFFIGVTVRG